MAKDHGLKIYFRTTPKLRGFYNRLTGALRATDELSSKKGYTSNDAIINALLLWAADRDPDDLARELAPHIAHFEEIWDEVLASQSTPEPPEPKPVASTGSSEDPQWVTGSIRQRTDGDNAQLTRKNRQSRDDVSTKPKETQGESEPAKRKGGRKGKSSP
ncbi:hypothetical protein V5E97_10085 [Singulisphaera sp. Ch08]|uniref:Uncharacterized protein n=1 Tax=Singulisphaera sp. Ch08 TaxID=3120278 RepID=A0AAU7CN70_9BACT